MVMLTAKQTDAPLIVASNHVQTCKLQLPARSNLREPGLNYEPNKNEFFGCAKEARTLPEFRCSKEASFKSATTPSFVGTRDCSDDQATDKVTAEHNESSTQTALDSGLKQMCHPEASLPVIEESETEAIEPAQPTTVKNPRKRNRRRKHKPNDP